MSEATQSAPASRSDASPSDVVSTRRIGLRPVLIATAGGLITSALLLGATHRINLGEPAALSLAAVATSQLDDAVLSLDSKISGAAAEDARQCKTPLAFVTVVAEPGSVPGSIRIRSGDYLSPSIRVTDSPRRVAVPFPAPYPTGKGVLSVEGSARGLTVWLSPGRYVGTLDGSHRSTWCGPPRTPAEHTCQAHERLDGQAPNARVCDRIGHSDRHCH